MYVQVCVVPTKLTWNPADVSTVINSSDRSMHFKSSDHPDPDHSHTVGTTTDTANATKLQSYTT